MVQESWQKHELLWLSSEGPDRQKSQHQGYWRLDDPPWIHRHQWVSRYLEKMGWVMFPNRKKTSYPLVNSHIAMENHHFSWENPLFLWSFSIAMLNYQRVYKSNYVVSEQDRCCKPSTASAHPEET